MTRTLGDVQLDGANASAEEAAEGVDEASESGIDIVLNHRLVASGMLFYQFPIFSPLKLKQECLQILHKINFFPCRILIRFP